MIALQQFMEGERSAVPGIPGRLEDAVAHDERIRKKSRTRAPNIPNVVETRN